MRICTYAAGKRYTRLSRRLVESASKVGMDVDVMVGADRGHWVKNVLQKASYINDYVQSYPDELVVYIDADAVILKEFSPEAIIGQNDIAGWTRKKRRNGEPAASWGGPYIRSGTIIVGTSERARVCIDAWRRSCLEKQWLDYKVSASEYLLGLASYHAGCSVAEFGYPLVAIVREDLSHVKSDGIYGKTPDTVIAHIHTPATRRQ